MTKILITGGGGFIARNLFEQLCGRYEIVSLNSRELDLLDAERVVAAVKGQNFDIVIHTSTYDPAPRYSTKDPSKVLQNNLTMFFNLVRCRGEYGRLIYLGSGAEFSRPHWIPKMKEEYFDRHVPSDQYGLSKYVMTKFAAGYEEILNLRVFSVFGKYEDWRYRLISRACCCAVTGMPLVIRQNVFFDYMFIDDMVRITDWFINNKPKHNVYNVCTSIAHDSKTIANMVMRISGKRLDVRILNEGLAPEYSGDNTRLMSELKGFEFTPMDEAVDKLYRYYEANASIIDKKEL